MDVEDFSAHSEKRESHFFLNSSAGTFPTFTEDHTGTSRGATGGFNVLLMSSQRLFFFSSFLKRCNNELRKHVRSLYVSLHFTWSKTAVLAHIVTDALCNLD